MSGIRSWGGEDYVNEQPSKMRDHEATKRGLAPSTFQHAKYAGRITNKTVGVEDGGGMCWYAFCIL